jgi:hypothetical protein
VFPNCGPAVGVLRDYPLQVGVDNNDDSDLLTVLVTTASVFRALGKARRELVYNQRTSYQSAARLPKQIAPDAGKRKKASEAELKAFVSLCLLPPTA